MLNTLGFTCVMMLTLPEAAMQSARMLAVSSIDSSTQMMVQLYRYKKKLPSKETVFTKKAKIEKDNLKIGIQLRIRRETKQGRFAVVFDEWNACSFVLRERMSSIPILLSYNCVNNVSSFIPAVFN